LISENGKRLVRVVRLRLQDMTHHPQILGQRLASGSTKIRRGGKVTEGPGIGVERQ
jgi:hypothetical protein